MKQVLAPIAVILLLFAAHFLGYWKGVREAQERALLAGATYATTACVAQNLVELRQVTRAIEARNYKPLIVECGP